MSGPLRAPLPLAVATARGAGALSRRLGRGGGTSLPGKLLLRLRPGATAELGARLPGGATLVSATNGKTTTTRLIASCAREAAWPLVSNPSGANLASGVATALLRPRPSGPPARAALFEVDEAALPGVAAALPPRVLVLMNLFRDQLDRYGELETLADRWRTLVAGLSPGAIPVLNADDPAIAALADEHPGAFTFGIDDPEVATASLPHAADSTTCRRCGAPLDYARVMLGHMGHWRCPRCDAARPQPQVRATAVRLNGVRGADLTIALPGGAIEVQLALPGLHNAYNAVAAAAAAHAMGMPHAAIARGLEASDAAFGRAERIDVDGREVVLLLAKNPAGANETVRTVMLDDAPLDLLVALNDRTADGRDVSWIWDVDYEPLLPRLAHLTLTGDRAHDLALRFRYAGHPPDQIDVVPEPERALGDALGRTPVGGALYVLPTYTAMLEVRRLLVDRGAARDFWAEG